MTCEQVLLKHIADNEGWHKKVSLYAIAEDWSPETVGRTLRDMQEDGKLEVSYYKGRHRKTNLATYRLFGKKQYRTLVTEYGEEIKIEI